MQGGNSKNQTGGFTIVELLIVVIVIAILAAITIIAYNGISNRAKTSAASAAAEQAAKKVMVYAATNSDQMPADLATAGVADQGGTTYQYRTYGSGAKYCITATTSGVNVYIDNDGHPSPTTGVCPGHSSDGSPTITNLMTNPSAEVGASDVVPSGPVTVVSSTDWAANGTRSFKVSNTGTADSGDMRVSGGSASSFPLGMVPGGTYTVSAKFNLPVAWAGTTLSRRPGILYWYSTNGSTFTESHGPKVGTAVGTYQTTYTFTIPANATGVALGFGAASTTAGQVVYYDSIMITKSSSASNYADGDSPGWAWNGTAGNSTSTGPAL